MGKSIIFSTAIHLQGSQAQDRSKWQLRCQRFGLLKQFLQILPTPADSLRKCRFDRPSVKFRQPKLLLAETQTASSTTNSTDKHLIQ
ncbi:hypothetical protein CEXT_809381 [Caerostris extrusa]|uniref:Uncharacterized protein n=1 Tax=Caerostris extrusa TaxID=172846 RepID=A0AAV4QZ40_CAEEX|nr:hypothetical protein CEXT_809381 [Caerostris extrusa]